MHGMGTLTECDICECFRASYVVDFVAYTSHICGLILLLLSDLIFV